jgi:3',5'-cyclic AMP phosphodiesterase CpdA
VRFSLSLETYVIRLAFTSDLHTDSHAANRRVWQEMGAILRDVQPDVFICCGDIAADARQFGLTLFALEHLPCPKLLVPGNHDVWIQNGDWVRQGITSREKYYKLLPALCREAGFHPLWLEPYVLGNIAFCGSMGWYDYSLRNCALDGQLSLHDYRRKCFQGRLWNDARFVHWYRAQQNGSGRQQVSDETLTGAMVCELAQQLQRARQLATRVIAVTHMVPFRAMMVYQQDAQWDYFSAFMGSVVLGAILQACPAVERVLAGHTHRKLSVQVGQITAHTSPLGYVRQWREHTPLAVAHERLSFLDIV